MGADVFISYPSREKQAADSVCHELEAGNLSCWIAPRDIPPGGDWAESIMSGIAECQLLVVVVSKSTGESRHVLREIERAVNRGVPLLPVRIDGTIPDGNLGYFLGTSHWFEAQGGEVEDVGDALRRAANDLIGGKKGDGSRPTPGPIAGVSRRGLLAGVAALILALAILGWLIFGGNGSGAGGATEAVQLSGDATSLMLEMASSTSELTREITKGSSTTELVPAFKEEAEEAARIARAAEELPEDVSGRSEISRGGKNLEAAAGDLKAISDGSAVPGLTEASSARKSVAEALTNLEGALNDLEKELSSTGSKEASADVSTSLKQLETSRQALLTPYEALLQAL